MILFKPQGLLGRKSRAQGVRAPTEASRCPGALAVGLLCCWSRCRRFLKNYGIYLFSYWLVFVIATMGLNLTMGYAGQKSLGHAAFFGIGAYTVAILMKAGFSFWLGLPLAMVGCFVVGPGARLSGAARADHLPGLRHARLQHRGLAGDAQRGVADRRHLRHQQHRAAGAVRLQPGRQPRLLLLRARHRACCWRALLWGLLRSPWGKAFTALRDNPIRAESLGIHIQAYTLLAFAIGAVYAGMAGALFASLVQFIEPAPFAVGASIMMYLMVVVGGPGYFFGRCSARRWACCCPSGCASRRAGTCSCSASR